LDRNSTSNTLDIGFYNCGWFGGSIPAAAITYGTNNINSDWSWRVPFVCQCFACVIVIVTVWFIPESPRWLMAHDRSDEAIAFLVKYHGNGNPNARLVRLEIEEMREGIRIDGVDKRWWDCKSMAGHLCQVCPYLPLLSPFFWRLFPCYSSF
jgi:MFS family permease